MTINFTPKELQIIALIAPDKSAEEIINIVLRDWFNNNVQRMHKEVKSETEILDEILTSRAKRAGRGVVE